MVKQDLQELFESALAESVVEMKATSSELAEYAAAQAQLLSGSVGTPGFFLAVQAARDNVALRAGIEAVRGTLAARTRFVGLIQGALAMAARMLAAAGA